MRQGARFVYLSGSGAAADMYPSLLERVYLPEIAAASQGCVVQRALTLALERLTHAFLLPLARSFRKFDCCQPGFAKELAENDRQADGN